MNDIFDFKRFGLVIEKDIQERSKHYLLLFVLMLGVIAVVSTLITYTYFYSPVQLNEMELLELNNRLIIVILIFFAVLGCIIASTIMEPMNSKVKKISFLSFPASDFEKFLSRWLIVTVGYVLLFIIAVFVADALRVGFCSLIFTRSPIPWIDWTFIAGHNDTVYYSSFVFSEVYYLHLAFSIFLFSQSLYVLGATFWPRFSFIKTYFAKQVLGVLFLVFCYIAIVVSYDKIDDFFNVLDYFQASSPDLRLVQTKSIVSAVSAVLYGSTILNWGLAFMRFKESEIINRF